MTEQQARVTANVIMVAGAVGTGYYILRTPPLRRLVWQLARTWTGPLLLWGATEIRRAWDASAP